MGARDTHGVVVVGRISTSPSGGLTIHRADSGGPINHGMQALQSDDWELFPSLYAAKEADHMPCERCFPDGRHDLQRA